MICRKCGQEIPDKSKYCMVCGASQAPPRRKPLKRENGTGSIYKRKDNKTSPYVAVAPTRYNAYGKAIREVIGNYRTEREARDALEDFRRAPTTRINITLEQLYDEWFPIGCRGKSEQLKAGYRAAWSHLTPLWNHKFREIRTSHMQMIIDDLSDTLSHSSLSKIKILLGLLYKYAMQNDVVHKNYALFIVLPKQQTVVKDCFTDLELKKIEKAVGAVPFADCILFLCYTGLRITEFLSLTPSSVRFDGEAAYLTGGIKTEAGKNRIVPVHPKILPILREWMEKKGQTVFCRPDGNPYSANYFRNNCFKPALSEIGVRILTPHAARRTFATRMSAAGVKMEDMIALMGHSDFSVDINHYIKQSGTTLLNAVKKLS